MTDDALAEGPLPTRLKRHREAASEAKMCAQCCLPIPPDAPVAQVRSRYGIAPVCLHCHAPRKDHRQYWKSRPCDNCGRLVYFQPLRDHFDGGSRPRRWVHCSYRCYLTDELERQRRVRLAKRQPIQCITCHQTFTPRRPTPRPVAMPAVRGLTAAAIGTT
jgi:hypothetical protein